MVADFEEVGSETSSRQHALLAGRLGVALEQSAGDTVLDLQHQGIVVSGIRGGMISGLRCKDTDVNGVEIECVTGSVTNYLRSHILSFGQNLIVGGGVGLIPIHSWRG